MTVGQEEKTIVDKHFYNEFKCPKIPALLKMNVHRLFIYSIY